MYECGTTLRGTGSKLLTQPGAFDLVTWSFNVLKVQYTLPGLPNYV